MTYAPFLVSNNDDTFAYIAMEGFPLATLLDCNCHLSTVWTLLSVEELGRSECVSFESLLGLMERTQLDCTVVLKCDTCRRLRFSLALITLVNGILFEHLEAYCNDIGPCQSSDPPSSTAPHASLGDYKLDEADSQLLARELIRLRTSQLSEMMVLLRSAITEVQSMEESDDLLQDSQTWLVCLESIRVNGDRLADLLHTLDNQT